MADQTDQPQAQPADTMQTTAEEQPVVEDSPLLEEGGLKELLRDNLFKDVKNSILTVVFGALLLLIIYKAFGFIFLNQKVGPEGQLRSGWEVVRDGPLIAYMVGPNFGSTGTPLWMVWGGVYTVALALGLAVGFARQEGAPPLSTRAKLGIVGPPVLGILAILVMTQTVLPWILTGVMAVVLFAGRALAPFLPGPLKRHIAYFLFGMLVLAFLLFTGFEPGNINEFGGLLLTVVIAFGAIVLCFPLGVTMALARRSSFPLLRPIAVAYIELIRGVPLITLLFMGEFALRFFFPTGFPVPGSIPRALIMITLFTGAYVAEVVRGGLQSVPNGQTEAGQAVGLSPAKITRMIVLPQALRNSIPALIGQFISVLKDTSLLIIIGQLDLFGTTKPILANLKFVNQGFTQEAYAFVGFLFWVICFAMSRASQRLETRLGVGTR